MHLLEIQKYTIDAKARAREEAADMKFAADIAAQNIAAGEFNLSAEQAAGVVDPHKQKPES